MLQSPDPFCGAQATTSRRRGAVGQRTTTTSSSSLQSQASATVSAAIASTNQRFKWSKDLNIDIMRCYYIATNNEENITGYRYKMYEEWLKLHPELSSFTEGNIADRKNLIIRKNYLTPTELAKIKQSVSSIINQNDEQTSSEDTIIYYHDNDINQTIDNNEQTTKENANQINDLELFIAFQRSFSEYIGSDPLKRPMIPKLNYNKRNYNVIKEIDSLIKSTITLETSLEEIHNIVYCGAYTAAKHLGIQLNIESNKTKREHNTPPWKLRIENKIKIFREQIAHLIEWKNNNKSKKVIKTFESICKSNKLNKNASNIKDKIIEHIDLLKQKLAVQGKRLRKYNQKYKRNAQNKQFINNEKLFYRNISQCNDNTTDSLPSKESFENFWSNLWSNSVQHNKDAIWIANLKDETSSIQMNQPIISIEEIKLVLSKTHNWKSPGPDNIHNYWWKNFKSVHQPLVNQLNKIIENNEELPEFLMKGKTYLIYKKGDKNKPENYRPITCLSTLYKIITALVSNKINNHIIENDILAEEQKGCRRGARGCKEELIIDQIICKMAKKKTRNLSAAWIDYIKAFDSTPHSWLIEVLKLYKIHPTIIQFLSQSMTKWTTTLYASTKTTKIVSKEIEIKRGIFQGDSLSPLWFCLALNPLSQLLNDSNHGFKLTKSTKINHQFYMDDLKLYGSNKKEIEDLLSITENFSKDICMDFGIDKCAVLEVKKGKIEKSKAIKTLANKEINCLDKTSEYKYLGFSQCLDLTSNAKTNIKEKYLNRVKTVLKSELLAKNKIKAVNTWAIPLLMYSFGILNWTETDLEDLNRKTRTLFTEYRVHHPKSAIERFHLPRKYGGRGVLDIHYLCDKQINNLQKYFLESTKLIHQTLVQIDSFTPLKLKEQSLKEINNTIQYKKETWNGKALHGRFAKNLNDNTTDKENSLQWLLSGGLFPETEGFIFAIQDQVIPTRNFLKYIEKQQIEDKCRLCNAHSETIQHISAGCRIMSGTEYTERHNSIAKIIHQEIAIKLELIKEKVPHYNYNPKPVLESQKFTLYWDRPLITDRTIKNNKPDIVIIDKSMKTATLVDIACPLDHNISPTESEKIRKYIDISAEIKDLWKLRENPKIIPLVISTNGLISKNLIKNLKKLHISKSIVKLLEKTAILHTCNIVRKFLQIS
jgi:hypothetical protein